MAMGIYDKANQSENPWQQNTILPRTKMHKHFISSW